MSPPINLHLFLSHPFISRCDLYFECLFLSNYTYFCHICFLADLPYPLLPTRILINTETGLTYLRFAGFFKEKLSTQSHDCLILVLTETQNVNFEIIYEISYELDWNQMAVLKLICYLSSYL